MEPKLTNSSLLVDSVSTIIYTIRSLAKLIETYEHWDMGKTGRNKILRRQSLVRAQMLSSISSRAARMKRVKKQQNGPVEKRRRLRVTQKNSIRDKQNRTRNEGRCDSTVAYITPLQLVNE